jgi:hypothetical protein
MSTFAFIDASWLLGATHFLCPAIEALRESDKKFPKYSHHSGVRFVDAAEAVK